MNSFAKKSVSWLFLSRFRSDQAGKGSPLLFSGLWLLKWLVLKAPIRIRFSPFFPWSHIYILQGTSEATSAPLGNHISFPCSCDKMPERSHLREEGLRFALQFRGRSPWCWGRHGDWRPLGCSSEADCGCNLLISWWVRKQRAHQLEREMRTTFRTHLSDSLCKRDHNAEGLTASLNSATSKRPNIQTCKS